MGDFKENLIKVLKTEPGTSHTVREESENKDYLKQIADDIHFIKIVIIVFAAIFCTIYIRGAYLFG